jgi:hypothetical protein
MMTTIILWPTASDQAGRRSDQSRRSLWHEEPDQHKDRIEASIREAIEDQWHTYSKIGSSDKDDDRCTARVPYQNHARSPGANHRADRMGDTSLEQLIDELLFERSHHDLFGEFSKEEMI